MPPFDLRKRSPLDPGVERIIRDASRADDGVDPVKRIRCPRCEWQPGSGDRWTCVPQGHPEHFTGGCGTSWNTFDTRGRCPGCEHLWTWTACQQCHEWSPHVDWYASDDVVR